MEKAEKDREIDQLRPELAASEEREAKLQKLDTKQQQTSVVHLSSFQRVHRIIASKNYMTDNEINNYGKGRKGQRN
jgi:hypothetical protein